MKLGPTDVGVFAITGGTQVTIADRLPPAERKASWELGYTAHQHLCDGEMIDSVAPQRRSASGFAQTADRTAVVMRQRQVSNGFDAAA